MKPAGRFDGHMPAGGFGQFRHTGAPTQGTSHTGSGSAGLPPPSFNPGFAQGSPGSNINPFATGANLNGLAGFGPAGNFNGNGTGLASLEAQRGFAHGAALQQQAQQRDQMQRTNGGAAKGHIKSRIREVWRGNLAQEMAVLRELVDKYPYISMVRPCLSSNEPLLNRGVGRNTSSLVAEDNFQDTEFPGIVARPMGAFKTTADYHYQTLRCNVDLLKVIQVGITLFDENGDVPPAHASDEMNAGPYKNNLLACPCTWQFNFQFSPDGDMCNQESIQFLADHGLNLEEHEHNGIDPSEFGSMLVSSGLVMLEDVKWISFHSGYDFAYLVKLMHCKELPEDESEYRHLLNIFFPSIYDIKFMIKHAIRSQSANNTPLSPSAVNLLNNLGQKAGLQDLADELGIKRLGTAHQAGSDSMLTGKVFWEVKKTVFLGSIDDDTYLGQIWGLNTLASGAAHPNYRTRNTDNAPSVTPNLNGATIYNPSTPASSHAGIASPPSHQHTNNSHGMGSLTPGGGGGVFGGFRGFSKS